MFLLESAAQYEIRKSLVHVLSTIFFKYKISSEIPDLINFKCFVSTATFPPKH